LLVRFDMIGIVVPTLNRPDWLALQLGYYRDVGFGGTIYIADSSEPHLVEQSLSAIRRLEGRVAVEHFVCPGMNELEAIRFALERVHEPFAAMIGDDDFLIPDSLRKCVDFLEAHSSYATVHGMTVQAGIELHDGAAADVGWVAGYPTGSAEQESGVERLLGFFRNYFVPLFSVHRTPEFLAGVAAVEHIPQASFRELAACSLAIVGGKSKRLDCLYLIRGHHRRRGFQPDMYDWICNPQWFPAFEMFRGALLRELQQRDGASAEESAELVKQAFWYYLGSNLNRKWQGRYGRGIARIQPILEGLGRASPSFRDRWRGLRSYIPTKSSRFTLNALRRRSSPYYADFDPFYRSLTTHTSAPLASPLA